MNYGRSGNRYNSSLQRLSTAISSPNLAISKDRESNKTQNLIFASPAEQGLQKLKLGFN
jgi:hypothetical protein